MCIRWLCVSLEEQLGLGFIAELLLLDCVPLFCIPLFPIRSLTTETSSGTSIVSRLRSQDGLGLKWFLVCQKATSGSFPLRTPYPICLHYGLIAIYIHLKYLLSTFYVSSTVPRAGAIKTNNMSS